MTRVEILALEAGPEIDALVAERVMGWHLEITEPSGDYHYWVDDAGVRRGHGPDGPVVQGTRVWRPSTDIAAAWQLVDLEREPFSLFFNGLVWRAVFGVTGTFAAEAKTAPLAICRAKLLSVSNLMST